MKQSRDLLNTQKRVTVEKSALDCRAYCEQKRSSWSKTIGKPICGDILPCPSSLNVAITAQNGQKS
jgi:hypothetical protein